VALGRKLDLTGMSFTSVKMLSRPWIVLAPTLTAPK